MQKKEWFPVSSQRMSYAYFFNVTRVLHMLAIFAAVVWQVLFPAFSIVSTGAHLFQFVLHGVFVGLDSSGRNVSSYNASIHLLFGGMLITIMATFSSVGLLIGEFLGEQFTGPAALFDKPSATAFAGHVGILGVLLCLDVFVPLMAYNRNASLQTMSLRAQSIQDQSKDPKFSPLQLERPVLPPTMNIVFVCASRMVGCFGDTCKTCFGNAASCCCCGWCVNAALQPVQVVLWLFSTVPIFVHLCLSAALMGLASFRHDTLSIATNVYMWNILWAAMCMHLFFVPKFHHPSRSLRHGLSIIAGGLNVFFLWVAFSRPDLNHLDEQSSSYQLLEKSLLAAQCLLFVLEFVSLNAFTCLGGNSASAAYAPAGNINEEEDNAIGSSKLSV